MPAFSPALSPVRIQPALRNYAWGDRERLPDLLGLPVANQPVAEAWYGAHPVAPSLVRVAGRTWPLDRHVADEATTVLGPRVEERFGSLPFLLKILSVDKPLSIQVHPDANEAEDGFRREECLGLARTDPRRNYPDRHHKPELVVALTRFEALAGFRPIADIVQSLSPFGELRPILPVLEQAGLRSFLEAWFAYSDEAVELALRSVLTLLQEAESRGRLPVRDPGAWVLHAHRSLGSERPDRGLLLVFMMNQVHLDVGQGLFVPAGLPHAYFKGMAVEVMANSDNVLRAGLTKKHVDPSELMRRVRWEVSFPPALDARPSESGRRFVYVTPPVSEFELSRLGSVSWTARAEGPEIVLALGSAGGGEVQVTSRAGQPITLSRGQACLLPHGVEYGIERPTGADVLRVCVPASRGPTS